MDARPAVVDAQTAPRGTETILIVDDDGLVRKTVQAILKSLGYTMLVAESGEAALEMFTQVGDAADNTIRLVITDLNMPGLDGVALMQMLKERFPSLPVILLTGMHEDIAGITGFAKILVVL